MATEQLGFTALGLSYDIFFETAGTSGSGAVVAIACTAAGDQAITGLNTTFPT